MQRKQPPPPIGEISRGVAALDHGAPFDAANEWLDAAPPPSRSASAVGFVAFVEITLGRPDRLNAIP
jgi:hypothetical protein